MEDYTLEPITKNEGYTLEPVEASGGGIGDTINKAASVVGRVGRIGYETAANLFSGLYAWPASKVAGITTLLLSGDHGAAKAVEEGVANELTVKPQTEEAQYITNQIGKLIDIPMSFLGEVARTGVQISYDTPFHPQIMTPEETTYIVEPAFQIGAMPGLMKIARMGVKSFGEVGRELPGFLKEITGRGVNREAMPGEPLKPTAPVTEKATTGASPLDTGKVLPGGEIGPTAAMSAKKQVGDLWDTSTSESFKKLPDYVQQAIGERHMESVTNNRVHSGLINAEWEKVTVPVAELKLNNELHFDAGKQQEYAGRKIYNEGPVVLDFDGSLLDGNHKFSRAIRNGDPTIEAYRPLTSLPLESIPVEKKALLHEFPKEINDRWNAAIPEEPTLMEKGKQRLNDLYDKATRVFEDLPNTAEYAPLKFELLNLQKYRGIASDKATRGLEEIVKNLDHPLMDIFEKKVILDDLFYTAEKGMDLPYGFTKDSLAVEKVIIDNLVDTNPRVASAIASRKARWEEVRTSYLDAMKEIGFDVEERFKNPDYYHHQVLAYAQAQNIVIGAGKLKTPENRGFLRRRENTELDINRDYLQVEHDVQAQMIHDIKIAEVIKLVDRRHNIADKIKAEAEMNRAPFWKKYIPEDHALWQPSEGNVFYMTHGIPEAIANELMTGALAEFGVTKEMLRPIFAIGGPKREFVLPKEVIKTLDKLVNDRPENVVSAASSWLMRQWKEKIALINPRGFFKYNARNLSGDAEAVFVGNPSSFSKASQSFHELYDVFFGDGKMSPDMNRFFEMGGFEGTMQAIEMKSFGDIKAFQHLYDKEKGLLDMPQMAWDKYWKTARLATDLREGILRYASYLDYLEQMKASPEGMPKNFGASIPQEIRALGDIERRAFWLQDDLLGAYDKVGVIGQDLRKHIWPFWSWKEVNAKRYIQLWKNVWDSGEHAAAVGRALGVKTPFLALNVGKFAIKVSALMAVLEVYNHTFFKEEEDLLPEGVKKTAHINFGRDSEGKLIYFDRLGIFQDFLANFGLDQSGKLAKDVLNGKRTIKEAALQMAKGPLNVVYQGITPWFKVPAELFSGRTAFPDVTRPGTIRDRKLYVANQLKLGEEYKALFGLPTAGYATSLKKMLVYSQDPGQAAYMDIMEEKRRFAERMGKEGEGFFITPKGNALYNYKLALRFKDFKAAEHYLDDYMAKGGNGAGLVRSMQAMNPLYGMNPMDRMQFLSGLNDESMGKLERAMDYYSNVLAQDRNDAAKEDKNRTDQE